MELRAMLLLNMHKFSESVPVRRFDKAGDNRASICSFVETGGVSDDGGNSRRHAMRVISVHALANDAGHTSSFEYCNDLRIY